MIIKKSLHYIKFFFKCYPSYQIYFSWLVDILRYIKLSIILFLNELFKLIFANI